MTTDFDYGVEIVRMINVLGSFRAKSGCPGLLWSLAVELATAKTVIFRGRFSASATAGKRCRRHTAFGSVRL